jgi:hypothetical protein
MFIYSAPLPSSPNSYIFFALCTTRSTYLYCKGLVQSMSLFFTLEDWIIREGQKDYHLGGRTTWHSDFSADQLVGPLGSRTSSPTSWSDCSALTSTQRSLRRRPVGWTARCLLLCQLAGRIVRHLSFIVSYTGGSPAKLGSPQRSNSSCKDCQLSCGLS